MTALLDDTRRSLHVVGAEPAWQEGCIACGRPMEAVGGPWIGGFFYHLGSPDLVCDGCARTLRPDLMPELELARLGTP